MNLAKFQKKSKRLKLQHKSGDILANIHQLKLF